MFPLTCLLVSMVHRKVPTHRSRCVLKVDLTISKSSRHSDVLVLAFQVGLLAPNVQGAPATEREWGEFRRVIDASWKDGWRCQFPPFRSNAHRSARARRTDHSNEGSEAAASIHRAWKHQSALPPRAHKALIASHAITLCWCHGHWKPPKTLPSSSQPALLTRYSPPTPPSMQMEWNECICSHGNNNIIANGRCGDARSRNGRQRSVAVGYQLARTAPAHAHTHTCLSFKSTLHWFCSLAENCSKSVSVPRRLHLNQSAHTHRIYGGRTRLPALSERRQPHALVRTRIVLATPGGYQWIGSVLNLHAKYPDDRLPVCLSVHLTVSLSQCQLCFYELRGSFLCFFRDPLSFLAGVPWRTQ